MQLSNACTFQLKRVFCFAARMVATRARSKPSSDGATTKGTKRSPAPSSQADSRRLKHKVTKNLASTNAKAVQGGPSGSNSKGGGRTAGITSQSAGSKNRGVSKGPTRPVIVFAPGAGGNSSSPWMARWAELLKEVGDVHPIDYHRVGRAETLVPYHKEMAEKAIAKSMKQTTLFSKPAESGKQEGERPLILIGKSMGGRVGCHVAVEHPEFVDAVICFSYPLRGMNGALRDKVLLDLKTPTMFLSGTRDKMCDLPELEKIRKRMSAESHLYIVDGGDHSLNVQKTHLKKAGKTLEKVEQDMLQEIKSFILQHI